MPVLAAFFGDANSNFLIETDENRYELATFPYSYESKIFSNQVNIGEFYKQIIETVLKNYKRKLSDFDTYVVSVNESLILPFKVIENVYVGQVLDSIHRDQVMLLGSDSAYAKGFSIKDIVPGDKESKDTDLCTNITLYSQIIPNDVSSQIVMDKSLTDAVTYDFRDTAPVIFTGERFNNLYPEEGLKYVTFLQLLKKPGIYEIFCSPQNGIILAQVLRMFVSNINLPLSDFLVRVGTIVRSSSNVECLIKSDIGTQQFFEVPKNSIFTIPLLESESSLVEIKSHEIGNSERTIGGGKIGLIVDTCDKDKSIYTQVSLLNEVLKQFSQRVTSIY